MIKKELIFLLLVTFAVILIWVVADILHTHPSQPIDSNLQDALSPVNPNFDTATLNKISTISAFPQFAPPTPSPTPSPTPLPTATPFPSPSLAPTPQEASTPANLQSILNP